jgi:ribonuclease P protein subunit POP4
MITAENIMVHELIGLRATVVSSLSLPRIGISGMVVDETKNTLVIRGGDKIERTVPKKGSAFEFALPGGKKAKVLGDKIAMRPFDRPKKLRSVA